MNDEKILELRKGFVTRAQAAELLSCHPNTVDRLIKSGVLFGVKLGKKVLVKKESIAEALGGGVNDVL